MDLLRTVQRWLPAGALALGLWGLPVMAGCDTGGKTMQTQDPQQEFAAATKSMGKVNSYHARVDLLFGKNKARIDGDWGESAVAYDIEQPNGKRVKNILTDATHGWVSEDGGKSWTVDPDPQGTARLSLIVSASLVQLAKYGAGKQVKLMGAETVDGTPTTHLQIVDKSPIDIWVADDAKLGKIIRKIHNIVSTEDIGDIDATIVYSAHNQPVVIKPPK